MISQAQGAALLTALQNGDSVVGFLGRQNEWIQSFELAGNLFNTGNNNGYTGPIESPIELLTGADYSFALTPGFAGQPLPEYTRMWLDENLNGQFESSELIYDQGAANVGPLNDMLTIPMTAMAGLSRLRVQLAYQGFGAASLPGNCGLYTSGETEDYCVKIKASNASLIELENTALTIYPNPSNGTVYLTTTSDEEIRIQVMSLAGQVVKEQQMNTATMLMDLNSLANGIYAIQGITLSGTTSKVQKLILAK
jgi:hypothetical protein